MMEKKEGIAVYIYRMQDKRDDKSQSPLFLSRAAARYAFGEGGEGSSKEASFRVEKGLRGIQKEEENIFQSVFSIRWKMNI